MKDTITIAFIEDGVINNTRKFKDKNEMNKAMTQWYDSLGYDYTTVDETNILGGKICTIDNKTCVQMVKE